MCISNKLAGTQTNRLLDRCNMHFSVAYSRDKRSPERNGPSSGSQRVLGIELPTFRGSAGGNRPRRIIQSDAEVRLLRAFLDFVVGEGKSPPSPRSRSGTPTCQIAARLIYGNRLSRLSKRRFTVFRVSLSLSLPTIAELARSRG